MHWGFGFWHLLPLFFFGKIFGIVILLLLIAALIRLFRFRGRHMPFAPYAGMPPYYHAQPGVPPSQPSAMEILRQRYARGEIDATTFEQMRERLERTSRPE